jgi:serine phosphatase RsbU (regulator of sigma subunit)/integral membrane sensor domain MASE1
MDVVSQRRDLTWLHSPVRVFAVMTAAYALLALSAYELFGALSIGVTFFPPAGLTFAAFLLLPRRLWLPVAAAIVVGEVLVDVGQGQGLLWSLGWAVANLTEPFVGAAVARRLIDQVELTPKFALGFLVGGLLVGPMCGAAIGASVLDVANDFTWVDGWSDVWVGDALGVLVVAPCVIVMARPEGFRPSRPHQSELLVAASVVIGGLFVGLLFFATDDLPVGYAAIPLLLLAAVRYGPRELAIAALLVASTLTAATAHGRGPWSSEDVTGAHANLVQQQIFLLAVIGGAWAVKLEIRARAAAVKAAQAAASELDRALERNRLLDDVARERDHIAALQALTAALATTTTTDEVVTSVRRHGSAVLGDLSVELTMVGNTGGDGEPSRRNELPLVVNGEPIAFLGLRGVDADDLDEVTESRLRSLSLLVTQALERAVLAQAQRQEHVHLAAMHEALSELTGAGTVADVARIVARQTEAILSTSTVALALTEPGPDEARTVWELSATDGLVVPGCDAVFDESSDLIDLVARSGRPVFLPVDLPDARRTDTSSPSALHRAALPLSVGGRRRVVLGLARPRPWSDSAQVRAVAYGSLVADALARTEQAESDHRIALTLQKALMPGEIQAPSGLRAAGRYLPATSSLEIGGDWYELLTTDENAATVIIGDVVGHNLSAAAAMGKLSAAARALAFAGHGPADVVHGLDLVAERTDNAMMTTMVCAALNSEDLRLHYCSAGHPPPLLRRADGVVVDLDQGRGTPLAVASDSRCEGSIALEAGALVVFYTDGLIDRRGTTIDEQLDQLRATLRGLDDNDPEAACEAVVATMLQDLEHADDVAILCLSVVHAPDRAVAVDAMAESGSP